MNALSKWKTLISVAMTFKVQTRLTARRCRCLPRSLVIIGTHALGTFACQGSDPMSTRGSGSESITSCGGGMEVSWANGVDREAAVGELLVATIGLVTTGG